MGAAAGAAGGASALQAAFQKASASMETGGDMSSMGSVVSSGGNGGGEAGTAGSSPFAQAAGFGDSGSLFKGLTFQKLCLPGAFRPGDHHNKMLRPGLCVVHASPQYL